MGNQFSYKPRIVGLIIILSMIIGCTSQENIIPTVTPRPLLPPTDTPVLPTPTLTPSSIPTQKPTATTTSTSTSTETAIPTLTETPTPTVTSQLVVSNQSIIKYFVHLGTGGNVGCGDSLVPASTGQLSTGEVVKDVEIALNSLFSTGVQYVGVLYNPLYQSKLSVQSIDYKKSSREMIVFLSGSFTKPKDNCDKLRYRAQVWQSIYQFNEVRRAIIWVNQHLLGDLLVPTNK